MKRKGIPIKEGFVDHLWKLGDRDEKLKDDIVKVKAGQKRIGMSGIAMGEMGITINIKTKRKKKKNSKQRRREMLARLRKKLKKKKEVNKKDEEE